MTGMLILAIMAWVIGFILCGIAVYRAGQRDRLFMYINCDSCKHNKSAGMCDATGFSINKMASKQLSEKRVACKCFMGLKGGE